LTFKSRNVDIIFKILTLLAIHKILIEERFIDNRKTKQFLNEP